MSNEIKVERPRPISAFPGSTSTTRIRPLSGSKGQTYYRQDLIQTVYTSSPVAQPKRSVSAKTLAARQPPSNQVKKKRVSSKAKQDLAEEILELKLRINGLNSDLAQQRGKTEQVRKKYNKCARVLKVEFENQRLWGAQIVNTHKVEGMRAMYDRVKQQYQALKADHNELLRTSKVTRELQHLRYIEALENELAALYERFQKIAQNSAGLLTSFQGEDQVRARLYILGQNEVQCARLQERYAKLKAKQQMTNENLKDRNKRIQFLQRYSRDLENKMRQLQKRDSHSIRQVKRLQTMLTSVLREAESSRLQKDEEIASLKKKIDQQRVRFEQEKGALILEKDQKISLILKENSYYQEMIRQLRQTNNELSQDCQQLRKNTNNQLNIRPTSELAQDHPLISYIQEREKTITDYASRQTIGDSLIVGGKRVRQTADQKFREGAAKKRKVDHTDVAEVSQLLRLRVIGQSVTPQRVAELLTYRSGSGPSNMKAWNQQYISMREAKQILSAEPFHLNNEQSELMARYLIQDAQQEFVFVDQNNQNYRSVVKSIFKALLGTYPIYETSHQLKGEMRQFLDWYGINLLAILKGQQPSGKVSKRKLQDVMKGAGAQCSQQLMQIILGKMSIGTDSLSALDYKAAFTNL